MWNLMKRSEPSSDVSRISAVVLLAVFGSLTATLGQAQETVYGKWHAACSNVPNGCDALGSIHAALTHNGYVITWRNNNSNVANSNPNAINRARVNAWSYYPIQDDASFTPCDPAIHEMISIAYPDSHSQWDAQAELAGCYPIPDDLTTTIFCSGHTFLPDGDLFVAAGGTKFHGAVYRLDVDLIQSSPDPDCLAPLQNLWIEEPVLPRGYFYPTVQLDKDGRVLLLGGNNCTNNPLEPLNTVHAFFTPADSTWTDIDLGNNLSGYYPIVNILTWPNLAFNGDVSIIGIEGGFHQRLEAPNYNTLVNDLADYPPPDNAEGASYVPLIYHSPGLPPPTYPNGSIIMFGSYQNSVEKVVKLWEAPLDASPGTWHSSPSDLSETLYQRNRSNAVYLPNGKILLVGGGIEVASTCGDPPASNCCDPHNLERFGRDCAALTAEMYDPVTGTSDPMATASYPRLYHSEALLMPDGRVFVAGGDTTWVDPMDPNKKKEVGIDQFEIFSPPYIFATDRLDIATTPTELHYGENARFTVDGAFSDSDIKVLLIKNGSVTHNRNFDQRVVRLYVTCVSPVDADTKCIEVAIPDKDTNLLPPGYYMLWITERVGVDDIPCREAKFVRVTAGTGTTGTCTCSSTHNVRSVVRKKNGTGDLPMPANFALGSPVGGEDTLVVYVDIAKAAVSHSILKKEITLSQPTNADTVAFYGSLIADFDPVLSGDYYSTTITLTEFGGCGVDSAEVKWGTLTLGRGQVNVRSPDIVVIPSSYCMVNLQDLSAFSQAYPPNPYDSCADYVAPYGPPSNLQDLQMFAAHFGDLCAAGGGGPSPTSPQRVGTSAGSIELSLEEHNPLIGQRTLTGIVTLVNVEPYSAMFIAFKNENPIFEFASWEPDPGYPYFAAGVEVLRHGQNEVVLLVTGSEDLGVGPVRLGHFVMNVNSATALALGPEDFALVTAELLAIGPPQGPAMVLSMAGLQYDRVVEAAQFTDQLAQNYPNPFNPTTTVAYSIAKPADVELKIYNVRGVLVRTLVAERKRPSNYRVTWDGKNNAGSEVASGVYFYRLIAGDFRTTKKMVLLR